MNLKLRTNYWLDPFACQRVCNIAEALGVAAHRAGLRRLGRRLCMLEFSHPIHVGCVWRILGRILG